MRKLDYKTTSFETGYEDFIIDIVESTDIWDEHMYETWLYREKTGIKIFVIGEQKKTYANKTIEQYARHMLKYIKIVWNGNMNFYDFYDEKIEDIELAACKRIDSMLKAKGI